MYDVSMATCWAWDFGVKEVSVYDASGVIKSMSIDLHKQQSTILHDYMVKYNKGEKKRPSMVKFSILSIENGKSYVGQVAQQMAKDNHGQIDIKLVDKYMHMNSVSDPDLMILYDGLPHNYVSLDGYPPWHIRLTEIANCSDYHALNYHLFSKCLYRFSKVQQRFGH
ncbi:Decaprenyl diphosphate synthase-like protein [Parasitella parasitica]|nr:Decaprenyl diphosphate synthase-like protein [Parasitella parasitica]